MTRCLHCLTTATNIEFDVSQDKPASFLNELILSYYIGLKSHVDLCVHRDSRVLPKELMLSQL